MGTQRSKNRVRPKSACVPHRGPNRGYRTHPPFLCGGLDTEAVCDTEHDTEHDTAHTKKQHTEHTEATERTLRNFATHARARDNRKNERE